MPQPSDSRKFEVIVQAHSGTPASALAAVSKLVQQGGARDGHDQSGAVAGQRPAEEIGEQPLGAGLGAIDANDAEVLGADGLDALDELSVGLLQQERLGRLQLRESANVSRGRFKSGAQGTAMSGENYSDW